MSIPQLHCSQIITCCIVVLLIWNLFPWLSRLSNLSRESRRYQRGLELCESQTASNVWPWGIFPSLAMSALLSRDELSMNPVSTKLWIMNFQSSKWLTAFQWLIQERAKQMRKICCKAQSLQSNSDMSGPSLCFTILFRLSFLCRAPSRWGCLQ